MPDVLCPLLFRCRELQDQVVFLTRQSSDHLEKLWGTEARARLRMLSSCSWDLVARVWTRDQSQELMTGAAIASNFLRRALLIKADFVVCRDSPLRLSACRAMVSSDVKFKATLRWMLKFGSLVTMSRAASFAKNWPRWQGEIFP